MTNQSSKIELFKRLSPSKYSFITRFLVEKLVKQENGTLVNVEMSLVKNLDSSLDQLTIKFLECTDIRVGDMNRTVGTLMTIYDISDRQLEGLSYRIVDEEGSYFSLNCRDFDFEVRDL